MSRVGRFPAAAAVVSACVSVTLALLGVPGRICGAPVVGEVFPLRQPDGTTVEVRVWGDEFYRVVESLDGYTLVRDLETRAGCYARLSSDGNHLVSSGIPVGSTSRRPPDLEPHLRINPASARAKIAKARARFADNRTEVLTSLGRGTDPVPACQGDVKGILLLVDFDDEPGTIPPSEFEDYCNQIGYNGYGNRGSVRDYFYEVSDGHLTYTNFVPTSYHRASQLKSWYEDPAYPCCDRTIQLVQEALFDLDSQGFDFSEYDSNGDGVIDAVNVFYAGIGSCPWPCGLTAHAWWVSFSADGVSTYWYQITPIWNALYLSVFCHENGHILCYWPDLYDHGHDSYGVGIWSLMGWLSSRTSPSEPDAYLKSVAGWADATLLTTPQVGLPVPADDNVFYKFEHPSAANEYFLIENRHHNSWDSSLPDSGLAIWHVDELGNNDWEQMTPEYHYRVSLEQADGNWDLEYMINLGDDSDLWASPDYPECTPETYPDTNWWDGSASDLHITDISTSSPTMTFDFGSGAPTEIPAVSEWGLVVMLLLLLSMGSVVLVKRQSIRG